MTSSVTTLKGIFPNPKPVRRKNFIQENVKNLRRMEQYFHPSKEVEDLEKIKCLKRQTKYQNVAARVNSSLHRSRKRLPTTENNHHGSKDNGENNLERKSSAPELNTTTVAIKDKKAMNKNKFHAKATEQERKLEENEKAKAGSNGDNQTLSKVKLDLNSGDSNDEHCDCNSDSLKYKSRGIQTVSTDNLEGIYATGVVRYSTARNSRFNIDTSAVNGNENEHCELVDQLEGSLSKSLKITNQKLSSPSKDHPDYVKLNKEKITVAAKMAAQLNNGILPSNYRKGVLPKYIKERKEERQQEKERKSLEEAMQAACPEGHVALPDNEKKETLKLLKKNYQELVHELNMLPIRSDTLRSQRRKIEIERQLTKLEEGIKIFSRPKVFVKINA